MPRDKDKMDSDSFWDLSADIKPSAINSMPKTRHTAGVKTSEIEFGEDPLSENQYPDVPVPNLRKNFEISPQKNPDRKLLFEYKPQNPLVTSVQVFTDKNSNGIFSKDNLFLRERSALIDKKGTEVPHTPFYSISPRYSQMTRKQLAYYLWWRENVRHGIWLECDVSYVLLYAHELIVSDDEAPDEVLRKLCKLYKTEVRGKRASNYGIGNLICDYCLLRNLHLPEEYLGEEFSKFLAYSGMPEFFVDISDRTNPSLYGRIIVAVSVYNHRKSKYYSENPQLFEKHMHGVIEKIFTDDKAFAELSSFSKSAYGEVIVSKKPFFGISGITSKQARIKVTYYPLTMLQSIITDALRYTENKIREHMGIKSKLNITTINPEIKRAIDEYTTEFCPPAQRSRASVIAEKKQEEKYAEFYDTPKVQLSTEKARQIELNSWNTTKKLVEAFSDSETLDKSEDNAVSDIEYISPLQTSVKTPVESTPAQSVTQQNFLSDSSADKETSPSEQIMHNSGEFAPFINLCLHANATEQRKFAKEKLITPDEIAEKINEQALNIIGDVLLEETENGYEIIEDYRNLFEER